MERDESERQTFENEIGEVIIAFKEFEDAISFAISGAVPGGSTVFRIDHDEKFNSTAHLQYQPFKSGPWFSFNWRYDSGQVAGAAPFATPGDIAVDASYLTPDQQFQAGLFCGKVRATRKTPISPNSTCPANQFGSVLLKIPAPGAEDDDHNPPRVTSRSLFDIGVGDDNLFRSNDRVIPPHELFPSTAKSSARTAFEKSIWRKLRPVHGDSNSLASNNTPRIGGNRSPQPVLAPEIPEPEARIDPW
jgi:hypothetical protein